jgi:hypothetical protein
MMAFLLLVTWLGYAQRPAIIRWSSVRTKRVKLLVSSSSRMLNA